MSAIYKLSIQGIRSFDSNDRETIEFGKPLTLIVGMNGSGKTTIIECLKYATTGDLPPNSKGGVFVHDPKITGEKDVRAQVKLAFTSTNGLSMIVTRNIQLLAKKTTTTFKTLEGQLVAINKSGERTTLSTRSVDLDSHVPLYLGVPKAILEYVIFCHQEDSLWPLSEPSNLKKKFDEIFQAMKFTKAIDNLKAIKKEMAVNIKLLTQSVEHLRIDRDRSRATKMKVKQLNEKINDYQSQVDDVEQELESINGSLDSLFKSNQNFQSVLSRIETLNASISAASTQIERLSNSIEKLDMPKVDLENLLKNFSESIEQKELDVKRLESKIASDRQKLENCQKQSNRLMLQQGELTAKKLQNENTLKSFQDTIRQIKDEHKLDLNAEEPPQRNVDHILKKKAEMESSVNEAISKLEETKMNLKEKSDSIRNSINLEEQKLSYYESDIKQLATKLDQKQKQISSIPADIEEQLKAKKAVWSKLSKELQEFEKENNITDINNQIKSNNEELSKSELLAQQIETDLQNYSKKSELSTKLSVLIENMGEKQNEINKITTALLNDTMIKEWGLDDVKQLSFEFKTHYIALQKNIATNLKAFNEISKSQTELEYELNTCKGKVNNLQHKKEKLILNINSVLPEDCSIEDYDDVLLETEVSYKTALENLKMHQTTLEFNRKALEVAINNDCCYLCSRSFENTEFRSKILKELKEKTDTKFEESLKTTLEDEKEYLNNLRLAEKDIYNLNSISSESKALQDRISQLSKELDNKKSEVAEANTTIEKLKEKRDHCDNYIKPKMDKIDYLQKEIDNHEEEKNSLNDVIRSSAENGDSVTMEQLQDNQKSTRELIWKIRSEIESLQEQRENISSKNNTLINQIRQANDDVAEIEKQFDMKVTIQEQIANDKKHIEELTNSKESIKLHINELSKSVETLNKENSEKISTLDKDAKRKKGEFQSFNKLVLQVNQLHHQLMQYNTSDEQHLQECERSIKELEKEMNILKNGLEGDNHVLNEQSQKLYDSTGEKRNLLQNIELIDLKEQLLSMNNELSSLNAQNAEAERDKYQQESARLRTQYERLSAQNAGKLGEIRQIQNQIDSLTQQLRSDYKDIDDKYQKEWVELQTRSFANDDIDTYSKALDSAIMKYHSLKMEDINRIIDELWKRTYTGTDIDTIKICSDEVGSTTKGKSYNYRVVMYKQDAELDMRGRCSAGQKVLASIIIRLALSETFGINCGVIALDEPTTNLDEENIESLAKSLHNIIEFRKHQKNFQLIVITHDEKFLNHMNAASFTDHFFRVKRDDRLKSLIEWVDINKVTE